MKRRSFLSLIGLAPVAVVAGEAKAAEPAVEALVIPARPDYSKLFASCSAGIDHLEHPLLKGEMGRYNDVHFNDFDDFEVSV